MDNIKIVKIIPARTDQIYSDWLSSEGHENITGGEAEASAEVGANYTAWDGYICGKNIALDSNKRIVQTWRTSEFSDTDPDSKLEVLLEPISQNETKLTLIHTDIPQGDAQKYTDGWEAHYFSPMIEHYTH